MEDQECVHCFEPFCGLRGSIGVYLRAGDNGCARGSRRACRHFLHYKCAAEINETEALAGRCPVCQQPFDELIAMEDFDPSHGIAANRRWFEIMDIDGLGVLPINVLMDAFKMLSIPVDMQLLEKLVEWYAELDTRGPRRGEAFNLEDIIIMYPRFSTAAGVMGLVADYMQEFFSDCGRVEGAIEAYINNKPRQDASHPPQLTFDDVFSPESPLHYALQDAFDAQIAAAAAAERACVVAGVLAVSLGGVETREVFERLRRSRRGKGRRLAGEDLQEGVWVKVKSSVVSPQYGWGDLLGAVASRSAPALPASTSTQALRLIHRLRGRIARRTGDVVTVTFPHQAKWRCAVEEIYAPLQQGWRCGCERSADDADDDEYVTAPACPACGRPYTTRYRLRDRVSLVPRGDRVPKYGWGDALPFATGVITDIAPSPTDASAFVYTVDFPTHPAFQAADVDLVPAPKASEPSKPAIVVGDRVSVDPAVSTPAYGWGGVRHGYVGTVVDVDDDAGVTVVVDFAAAGGGVWKGPANELVVVQAEMGRRFALPAAAPRKRDHGHQFG